MIDALRAHPSFVNAWLIFCCERNMAHEASYLANVVLAERRTVCVAQKGDRDYGWWTGNVEKVQYAYRARMSIAQGSVALMRDLLSANPWRGADAAVRSRAMRDKFEQQLRRYRLVHLGNDANPLAPARMGVSGKVDMYGRTAAGHTDDLAFCFTFNMSLWDTLLKREVPGFEYARIGM